MEPGTPALVALAWHASESHTVLASSGGAPHRPGQKSRLIEQQYWPKLKTSPLFCRKPCEKRNGWLEWDVHNTAMHSRAVETNILDQSCSFPRRNGFLVLFLGFILLLHCPNVHLTINFPLANTKNITKIQIYIYCMSTKRRPYSELTCWSWWWRPSWAVPPRRRSPGSCFPCSEPWWPWRCGRNAKSRYRPPSRWPPPPSGWTEGDTTCMLKKLRHLEKSSKSCKNHKWTEAAVFLLVHLSSGHLWMIAKSGDNWIFCGCAHATGLDK